MSPDQIVTIVLTLIGLALAIQLHRYLSAHTKLAHTQREWIELKMEDAIEETSEPVERR